MKKRLIIYLSFFKKKCTSFPYYASITNVMDWWAVKREKNSLPSPCHFSCAPMSLLLLPLPAVCESHGGCAEVDSLTEAVVGKGFLLGCISCKNREEVRARATVDWHFKPPEEEEFRHVSHTQVHSNLESNFLQFPPFLHLMIHSLCVWLSEWHPCVIVTSNSYLRKVWFWLSLAPTPNLTSKP